MGDVWHNGPDGRALAFTALCHFQPDLQLTVKLLDHLLGQIISVYPEQDFYETVDDLVADRIACDGYFDTAGLVVKIGLCGQQCRRQRQPPTADTS